MDSKILLASGIIDFYVDKKKFDSLKKDFSKKKLVERTLWECLASLRGLVINGVEIRDVSITSNNFWGEDLCFVNDLGYSGSNLLKLNEDHLTSRVFQIDLVGVIVREQSNYFFDIRKDNFLLTISSNKIV